MTEAGWLSWLAEARWLAEAGWIGEAGAGLLRLDGWLSVVG